MRCDKRIFSGANESSNHCEQEFGDWIANYERWDLFENWELSEKLFTITWANFFFSVLIIFRQPFRDGFSNKQLLHLLVCNYVLLKLICICYYDLINDRKFMTFVWAFSLKAFTISTLSLWSRKRLKNENYFLCQDSSNARS